MKILNKKKLFENCKTTMIKKIIKRRIKLINLKITARMKVRAGVILLMAEAKVGLLYLTPMYPVITYVDPNSPRSPILHSIEKLNGGSDLDLSEKKGKGRRRREARR
uniref:Uncharacterized protein n=1 Tax=Noccaea caerulescens TaxID=107243 RepID=A0A1J3JLM6_NOCCA